MGERSSTYRFILMHTSEQVLYWNIKIIHYGDFTEVFKYDKIFKENYEKVKKATYGQLHIKFRDLSMQRALYSVTRSQRQIKRLIIQNFSKERHVSFATLTFRDNISDLSVAHTYYKNFTRRLRKFDPNVKYLGVAEFQKRGAVHYHVVLSTKQIPKHTLSALWPDGNLDIHKLRSIKNIASYVTKYMQKGMLDSRLCGRRAFYYSRNLIKPLIYKCVSAVSDKLSSIFSDLRIPPPSSAQLIHSADYLTAWAGQLKMSIYKGLDFSQFQL